MNIERKVQAVEDYLGPGLIDEINKLETPRARRPFIAKIFDGIGSVARTSVQSAIGCKINSLEWTNIKIHAKYPGVFVPVEQPDIHRCRVPTDLLLQLLRYIESPANAQRYAFGTKVLSLAGGDVVTIDNVLLRMKLDTFVITL